MAGPAFHFRKTLRSHPRLYRGSIWLRECLIPALKAAFWEFYRSLLNLAWHTLYSTEKRRRRSRIYRWTSSIQNGPPFREFSAYQALRCGWPKLKGRIILEDQGYPVVMERSLLAEGTTDQYSEQPWPILWSHHSNANLVARSLAFVVRDKELCMESVFGHRFFRGDPALRYWRLPEPVVLKGNWTSVVSRWVPTTHVPNHSHWLLEALPRLALLKEFPEDTQIIVPSRLAKYQRESLAMLGLPEARLRFTAETHLQVENYYFSAPPSMIACYSPYAVKFLRSNFLDKADRSYHGPKRFFISRADRPRNIANTIEIEDFFRSIGWAVIDVAELSFAQEIQLFSQAEAICSMLGSGLINTVFCRPECAVVAIAHDYWTDGVLDWILQVVGITKYSVHVYPADDCRRFEVDKAVLKRQLKSLNLS